MARITKDMSVSETLSTLRNSDGYFITNTARDMSQSDYKNRILLDTDLVGRDHYR